MAGLGEAVGLGLAEMDGDILTLGLIAGEEGKLIEVVALILLGTADDRPLDNVCIFEIKPSELV